MRVWQRGYGIRSYALCQVMVESRLPIGREDKLEQHTLCEL